MPNTSAQPPQHQKHLSWDPMIIMNPANQASASQCLSREKNKSLGLTGLFPLWSQVRTL